MIVEGEGEVTSSPVPSANLADLLEQLGTLNDRHEHLRALVEALEVKKMKHEKTDSNFLFFSFRKRN